MNDDIESKDSQALIEEVIKSLREGKISDAKPLKRLVVTLLTCGVMK